MDDITALVKGKNKEVAEMAKNKLSVTENGKEGKCKMIASCAFLESKLSQFRKEEGVTLADNAWSGLEHRSQVVGSERECEKKKVQGEVLDYQEQ